MVRAYSISAADIETEKKRVGGDVAKFNFANAIKLDSLELRPMGPRDVHLRILEIGRAHV